MTTQELNELDDDALFEYFTKHAGRRDDAPDNAKYSIRLGSRHLHAAETHELREKFFKAVRETK